MIVQALAAGANIGELSCPTQLSEGASSISFRESVRYGFGVLRTAMQYRAHSSGRRDYPYLRVIQPLRGGEESNEIAAS
jgi:hypothetical protein